MWPQDKAVLCVGIKAAGTWAGLAREGWQGACGDRAEGVSRGHHSDASPFLQELCVMYLPRLYLDIHNYCVLAKLRDFVASPHCWRVAPVDALKDKVRKLYTIMNSFCRRDLVFLSDDCSALDYPIPATTVPPDPQG
ncbi:cytokine-like protein 1 [Myotis lucifugus]|uniref:Cytokine-like protein 1 n=1 Tax=Myotis brandtii TaxID=109478 RepID=S7MTB0_MYOBR|nr:cytokine-like protein 1 [Myotis lucifugus]XP_014395111.1 PREDICTED: cytokine-like protein 1 [Myotis brandtii]EPQ07709.1 Cytokine-like protein 1 [Myotis brandtii]